MNKDILGASWSKREKDIMIRYPNKRDGNLLYGYFRRINYPEHETSLLCELEKRGYDLTTIKFSIKRKHRD